MTEQNFKELSKTIASQNRMMLKLKADSSDLKPQSVSAKTCPQSTYFGSNYPKNGVGLAVTLDKNVKFSKVLLSPKFNNYSIIIDVKKEILYYIVYPTLEWNIDPI